MTDLQRFMSYACQEYGCVVCRALFGVVTPAEAHHPIGGRFRMGKKREDKDIIPVCPHHHRTGGKDSIHGDGNETRFLRERTGKTAEELNAAVWKAFKQAERMRV